MSTRVLENLQKLREFLTAERWTKGVFAKQKEGSETGWKIVAVENANDDCKFCILGAVNYLFRGENETVSEIVDALYKGANKKWPYDSIMAINDFRCHKVEEIHELIDESIKVYAEKTEGTA